MLRNALLGLGGSLIAAAVVLLIAGNTPPAMVCLVWGGILVFGIVYERYAYKTIVDKVPAGKDWARTTERFVDQKTGKIVTVYVKPMTGERAYVAEPQG